MRVGRSALARNGSSVPICAFADSLLARVLFDSLSRILKHRHVNVRMITKSAAHSVLSELDTQLSCYCPFEYS